MIFCNPVSVGIRIPPSPPSCVRSEAITARRAPSIVLYSTNAMALILTKSILTISPYLLSVERKTSSETGGVVSVCCQLLSCSRKDGNNSYISAPISQSPTRPVPSP